MDSMSVYHVYWYLASAIQVFQPFAGFLPVHSILEEAVAQFGITYYIGHAQRRVGGKPKQRFYLTRTSEVFELTSILVQLGPD